MASATTAGVASATTAPSFPELQAAVERLIVALDSAASQGCRPVLRRWHPPLHLHGHRRPPLLHRHCPQPPPCSDNERSFMTTFYLVLRKWYPSLHLEKEFGCFACRRCLVDVSQCEVTSFYQVLLDRRHEIQRLIKAFFVAVVQPRFGSENYTFDVYVTGVNVGGGVGRGRGSRSEMETGRRELKGDTTVVTEEDNGRFNVCLL